jgi:hypothetical protein
LAELPQQNATSRGGMGRLHQEEWRSSLGAVRANLAQRHKVEVQLYKFNLQLHKVKVKLNIAKVQLQGLTNVDRFAR